MRLHVETVSSALSPVRLNKEIIINMNLTLGSPLMKIDCGAASDDEFKTIYDFAAVSSSSASTYNKTFYVTTFERKTKLRVVNDSDVVRQTGERRLVSCCQLLQLPESVILNCAKCQHG
jgi:hypothetical protein